MQEVTLEKYIKLVEDKLYSYINGEESAQGRVIKAMKYSLSAGGKRIRPVLVLEFCRMCGGDVEKALPIACAMEMIHTFSLIHDDLPCMDNDDLRRGKPSCHKAFDEATALLAGDALEIYPIELIAKSELEPEKIVKIISEITHQVGVFGMIGGQQIDTENEGKPYTPQALLEMYSLKTSALLKAACCSGCIAAGADEDTVQNAAMYAEKLGLAFQIVDDILDVTGDEKVFGKPIGSDAESGKTTYVTLYGLEKAHEKAEELTNEALEILSNWENSDFIKELTKKLLNRNK